MLSRAVVFPQPAREKNKGITQRADCQVLPVAD